MELKLNLVEEFLLIALDDDKGQFVTDSIHLSYGLAGAVLLELAVSEHIEVVNERIKLAGHTVTGNQVLDEVIDGISSVTDEKKTKYWIEKVAKKAKHIKEVTLQCLIEKGILSKKESKILWIIPNNKYPTENPNPENKIRKRLHDVMLNGSESSPKDIMLLSLIDACELIKEVFRDKGEQKLVGARIKEVTQDIKISRAINKTIRDIQAAIMLAIVTVVITSTVTSGSS